MNQTVVHPKKVWYFVRSLKSGNFIRGLISESQEKFIEAIKHYRLVHELDWVSMTHGLWPHLTYVDPQSDQLFSRVRHLCLESQFQQSSIQSIVWWESRNRENNSVLIKCTKIPSHSHDKRSTRNCRSTLFRHFEIHFLQINRVNFSNLNKNLHLFRKIKKVWTTDSSASY